jgi:hypothetical protein
MGDVMEACAPVTDLAASIAGRSPTFADVIIRTSLPVESVREQTEPRDLTSSRGRQGTQVILRMRPGDVEVVRFALRP